MYLNLGEQSNTVIVLVGGSRYAVEWSRCAQVGPDTFWIKSGHRF